MEDCHADVIKKNKNVDSVFTLFSNLTGEKNQNPRYCYDLLKNLRNNHFNVGSGSNLEYSIKRLVRGLGATRLHSQCGCFAALTCVLKYQACTVDDVLGALEKEQRPGLGATKAEMKALSTGCVLTCGAIIHSGLFTDLSRETQEIVIRKLIDSGKKKSYLSFVIHKFLVDAVYTVESNTFKDVIWLIIKSELLQNLNECNADGFYLLLSCLRKFPKTVSKFLQKNSHSPELLVECVIDFLMKNSVKCDHPIYEAACHAFSSNFNLDIWKNCVQKNANITPHKDAILVTIFFHLLKNIQDKSQIPKLLVPRLVEIIIKVMSFKKSKSNLDQDSSNTARSALNTLTTLLCDEVVSDKVRLETIKKLLFYPANMKFEMKTGTKCIYTLASKLNGDYMKKLLNIYKEVISGELRKKIDEDGTEENWNIKEKQQALNTFTRALNHPTLKTEINWKLDQIKFIFDIGLLKKYHLPSEVQKFAKDCFYRAIMLQMPSLKDLVVVLDELALYVNNNIGDKNLKASEEVLDLWSKMYITVQNLQKKSKNKLFISVHVLLIYMGLHLFLDSDLAKGGIEELLSCYSHLKEVHKKQKEGDDVPHWTEVTIDLILSLLSRENKLWRHVVSCIFPQVVPHMTPTALQQIIDALDPKSQNSILKHLDSDSESEDGEDNEENESEEESESSLSEDADEDEGTVNDQLRMAVRNALGYSAAQTDEESVDMDDMNEEEEKRLNESLAEAFRQFKAKSHGKKKKQTKEEEALTHFRLRVLDLVEIYITNNPSMSGCLDLILPLLDILELSIKDQHQRPLQNRTDSILKHLAGVKNFSEVNVTQTIIKDVFESVISRKEIPALIFVEMSPRISDCATFLVRCSQLVPKDGSDIPLVEEYDVLIKSFFQSRDFKLPISMFQSVLRISWKGTFRIVETLFEFLAAPNLRIFKKMKIIELLTIFYKKNQLHNTCDDASKQELTQIETHFLNSFINTIVNYENNGTRSTDKMFTSFFSNVITLLQLIHLSGKRHREGIHKSPPWKNIILKLSEVDLIINNKKTKCQLANLANLLKVQLKIAKRKRTISEASVQKSEEDSGEDSEEKEDGEGEEGEEEDKPKKKKKKKSPEKAKFKKESRKLREEISSNGLELIRFSAVDSNALPEAQPTEEEEDVEQDEEESKPKKRKVKDGDTSKKVKRKHEISQSEH